MFGLFGRRRSRDNVKERLKLVLSYDRAKLTPGKMQELKTELLAVIGKYFPSEDQEYDVRFEQQGERMVLMANLPLSASRDGEDSGDAPQAAPAQAQSGGQAVQKQSGSRNKGNQAKRNRKR